MATFQIIAGCDPHRPGSSVTGLVFLPERFLLQSAAGFCLTAATSVRRPLGATHPCPRQEEEASAELGFHRGRVSLLSESSRSGQSAPCPAGGFGEGRPRLLSPPPGEAEGQSGLPGAPSRPGETWGRRRWWARVELAVVDGRGSRGPVSGARPHGVPLALGTEAAAPGAERGRAGVGLTEPGMEQVGRCLGPIMDLRLFSLCFRGVAPAFPLPWAGRERRAGEMRHFGRVVSAVPGPC